MSDSNRTTIALKEEATWGVTPACAFTKVRFTGESLGFNIDNITSQEIRDDRQTSDLIQTGASATGGINFELSYGTFDTLLRGAFCSDWIGVGGGSTESITAGATTLNFVVNVTNKTLTLGSAVTFNIIPGQVIKLTDMGTNSGYRYVTAVNTTTKVLTLSTIGESATYTATAKIIGARMINGNTKRSYSIERKVDMYVGNDYYFIYRGMMVNQMQFSVQSSSIATGSFDFMGKDSAVAVTSYATGAYVDAPQNVVLNAVSNVGQVMEGANLADLSGVYFQSLDFTMNNKLRGKQAIGVMGNFDVGLGALEVSGNVTAYFANADLYNKYVNATETGLAFKIKEGSSGVVAGKGYFFIFPRVKFSSDNVNAEGIDTDITEKLGFTAIKHATYGFTAMVCRFAS